MRFSAPKRKQADTRVKQPTKDGGVKSVQVWGQRRAFSRIEDLEPDDRQAIGFLSEVEATDVTSHGRDYIPPKQKVDHTHDAKDIVSGLLGSARMGSGSANSTVFLRGDRTWAATGGGSSSDSFKTISCPAGTSPVADSATDTLILAAGAGITITGNSGTDTITIAATGGGSSNSFETINCPNGTDPVADSSTDTLNLVDGAGITITGNSATDSITVACTITQYTDELAQDAVGGALTDSSTIDFTYNDGANTITAIVIDGSITYAKIQSVADARLLGRSAGSAGVVQELTVGAGLSLSAGDLSSTITQYTDEMAQDAVGGILADSSSINFTYDDAGGTITAVVIPGGGGTGDVLGPASSTDNALPRWDGTTGKLLQDSGVTLDDTNNMLFPTTARAQFRDTGQFISSPGASSLRVRAASTIQVAATTTSFRDASVARTNFEVGDTASAVNYNQVAGGATGNPTTTTAVGSDADISVNMIPKGTGTLQQSGVPVATTTGTQTLTNKTLTTPTIGDFTNAQHDHLDADDGGTLTAAAVSDFTEAAQDATGAMVGTSLVYNDGAATLQRAALTGDVTASQDSNATTLATVNANVGTFGTATQVSTVTVNAKGLVTVASNTAIAVPSTQVTDFTEAAQDATGAMVGTSLVYSDAGATLQRAALTGDITAAQDSNATTLATKLRTRSHIFYTEGPFVGTDVPMLYVGDDVTILAIRSAVDSGTVSFNIEQRGKFTPRTAGTDIMAADQAADVGGEQRTSIDGFADGTVPADSNLAVTVSAITGSPTWLWVNIEYTID